MNSKQLQTVLFLARHGLSQRSMTEPPAVLVEMTQDFAAVEQAQIKMIAHEAAMRAELEKAKKTAEAEKAAQDALDQAPKPDQNDQPETRAIPKAKRKMAAAASQAAVTLEKEEPGP